MPKPKGSKSAKKHKIFSGSMQEAISRALAVDDVRQLSKSDLKLLRERISINRSIVKRMNPNHPLAQSSLANLNPTSTLSLFLSSESAVREQAQIMQDLREIASNKYKNLSDDTITETLSNIQENIPDEFTDISDEVTTDYSAEFLKDEDKWTILRRLATQVFRLNIDRAYASETLRELEDEIENNPYQTISDITDKWLEEHKQEIELNKKWNWDMRGFKTVEDSALASNRGFHGVEKAMNKMRVSMDAYEPAWERPDGA